jgi:hypothetical protein
MANYELTKDQIRTVRANGVWGQAGAIGARRYFAATRTGSIGGDTEGTGARVRDGG